MLRTKDIYSALLHQLACLALLLSST